MTKITTTAELKNLIQILVENQELKKSALNEQFMDTIDLFKPVNLMKSAVKKFTVSPFLLTKLLGPALGLAAGYFLKRK